MPYQTRQAGFTLVELMIVVAIIAVLASVALPQYNSYIATSRGKAHAGNFDTAVRWSKSECAKVLAGGPAEDAYVSLNGGAVDAESKFAVGASSGEPAFIVNDAANLAAGQVDITFSEGGTNCTATANAGGTVTVTIGGVPSGGVQASDYPGGAIPNPTTFTVR